MLYTKQICYCCKSPYHYNICNYFFAKSQGGRFILRIEDTDQTRFSPESLQDIYDTFDWLGIREDEGPRNGGDFGPYIQSERLEKYRIAAEHLVKEGQAYHCFCSPERLETVRQEQVKAKSSNQGYDRACRNLSPDEIEKKHAQGMSSVIRLKVPLEGETSFSDVVLGTVVRKNSDVNPDPVILKSDGYPTYHLANVIDDHEMAITHIMRAQEWIPSGPLHVILYKAFGWTPPIYAHLPMVMGSDGQKLSKRHGSTSLVDFRKQGYLPEAIINYISLLGWSFDSEREFFSRQELETLFYIEGLQKSPAVFDYKKLRWFNGHYIRNLTDSMLSVAILPSLVDSGLVSSTPSKSEVEIIEQSLPLARERLVLLNEAPEVIGFLFKEELDYETSALVPKGLNEQQTREVLGKIANEIDNLLNGSPEDAEAWFHETAEKEGRKLGQLMMPARIAITGTKASPPLIPSIRLLGREKSVTRLEQAQAKLAPIGD